MAFSKTVLLIGISALVLVFSGCFDWDMAGYQQGGDGDADADADVDADADADGTLGQGQICSDTSQCLSGYQCGGTHGDPAFSCRQTCVGTGECHPHGANSVCQAFDVGGSSCTVQCDPFWPDCISGSHCSILDTGDGVTFGTACSLSPGFGMDGDACTTNDECAAGYICALFDGYMCARTCSNPGGSDSNCLFDFCVGFDPQIRLVDGRNIGACLPYPEEGM